jgi:hypothetical protein
MKHFRLLVTALVFSLIGPALVSGQTSVSGGIFSNTNWDLAGSPYLVTDDIVVFPNATLTIEPGVEVRFASGTILELRNAFLIANGTADAGITFTLDSSNPTGAPKWLGIANTSLPSDTVGVEMDYVTIEYAETGINYGSSGGNRFISNSIFRNNDRAVYDGTQGYNWMTITDSDFLDNGIGIQGRMSAINCTFTNNEFGIADPLYFNNGDVGGRVTNCTFIDNDHAIATAGQVITFAAVENCTFTNNPTGIFLYSAEVDSSFFDGSTTVAAYLVKGFIQNSNFNSNEIGVQVGQFPYQLSITNNQFLSNNYALWVDGPGALIEENALCTSLTFDAYVNTQEPVDLTNNCWCTTDPLVIETQIFDAFDDVSSGIATFDPFTLDCFGSLLYPGDTDNSGSVTTADLFPIGLYYGEAGPPRTNATTQWWGQEAPDWTTSMTNGSNLKYVDADGNGFIDEEDAAVIPSHLGSVHPNSDGVPFDWSTATPLPLYLEGPALVAPGQEIEVSIMAGTSAIPSADLYGLALEIGYNPEMVVPGTFTVSTAGSWLGDDLLQVQQEETTTGLFQLGLVKTNQLPASGYGPVANISFVLGEDLILMNEGIPNEGGDLQLELILSLLEVTAISSTEQLLPLDESGLTLPFTSVQEVDNTLARSITVFPNPTDGEVVVQSTGPSIQQVRILTAAGRAISDVQVVGTDDLRINFPATGLYLLQIITTEGIVAKKVIAR